MRNQNPLSKINDKKKIPRNNMQIVKGFFQKLHKKKQVDIKANKASIIHENIIKQIMTQFKEEFILYLREYIDKTCWINKDET